jgi:hypothetical protein
MGDDAWVRLASDEELKRLATEPAPGPTPHPYDWGYTANVSRLMRAHARIGRAYGRLFAEVMGDVGYLTRREKELVAAVATAAQDCHY